MTLSSVSSSVASTVPAAVWFSAASKVAEDVNAGATLSVVREPSTLWSESVPSRVWAMTAAAPVATLVIVPFWASPLRLPTRVRVSSPIQMPLVSSSLDTTV